MSLPFHLRVEKRLEEIPRWLPFVTSLGAVVLAFLISGLILALIGGDPDLIISSLRLFKPYKGRGEKYCHW